MKKPQDENALRFFEERFGKRIDLTCSLHGDYKAYENMRDCPDCMNEREEKIRQKEQRERNKLILRQRWARAGLPEKFCGACFSDWNDTTDKMSVAKEAAKLFASDGIKRMLFIGRCGTGKTLLAAATIGALAARDKSPVYITATRMIRSIRESWINKSSEQEAMDVFIDADYLVIDELGGGRGTDDERRIISEIICDRYGADRPTLLISNLTADELKEHVLDERAADRLREEAEVIVMDWPSFRSSGRDK